MNEHAETIIRLLQVRITNAESEAHCSDSFVRRHRESTCATMRAIIAKDHLEKYRAALEWLEGVIK